MAEINGKYEEIKNSIESDFSSDNYHLSTYFHKESGFYENGKREGIFIYEFFDSNIRFEVNYKNGIKEGKYTIYRFSKKQNRIVRIYEEGEFANDEKILVTQYYYNRRDELEIKTIDFNKFKEILIFRDGTKIIKEMFRYRAEMISVNLPISSSDRGILKAYQYKDDKLKSEAFFSAGILKKIIYYNDEENIESIDYFDIYYDNDIKEFNSFYNFRDKKDLFEEITGNEIYNLIYQDIKNLLWKNVLEKCKISKESLMSYKFNGINGRYETNSHRDKILKKLDVLNELIELYESKKFNEFLKKTNFSIQNKNDKSKLKEIMNFFMLEDRKTIEEVLDFSEKQGLIKEDVDFDNYISAKGFYLWERIKKISFKEYRNSILYLKEFSPISTQHSIKGSEFDNVLVVLESNWNKYDFKTLFGKGSKNENVIKRARKLFYVCMTRAKKNLVIYMPTEDLEIINSAKGYFGEENVLSIDSI